MLDQSCSVRGSGRPDAVSEPVDQTSANRVARHDADPSTKPVAQVALGVDRAATTLVELLAATTAAGSDDLFAALAAVESARRAIDAARLSIIGELDAREEPAHRTGLRTRAWLGHEHGATRAGAGRDVSVARRLRTTLPLIADALACGRITLDHAALISRLTTPRVEAVMVELQAHLLDLADGVRFERWAADVRALIELADTEGGHRPTPPSNRLHLQVDGDGVLHLEATLVGADAAVVAHHLRRAGDAAFRRWTRDQEAGLGGGPGDGLGGGDGNGLGRPAHSAHLANGLVDLVRRGAAAVGGSGPVADVTLTIPVGHPALVGRHGGGSVPDQHGQPVHPDALDLLTCDATITALVVDSLGTPLDLGTTVRFADRGLRRALAARDGGCVFPGCDAPPAWTDAHHVVRAADGGATSPENLASLCRHHHGVVHSDGWSMRHVGEQRFQVVTPDGDSLDCQRHQRPAPPPASATAQAPARE